MTEGSDELPPECDFCGHIYGETETDDRVPVYFGTPSVETRGDRWLQGRAMTDGARSQADSDAAYAALKEAINNLGMHTNVSISRGVRTLKQVGSTETPGFVKESDATEFERRHGMSMEIDRSRLGVTVEAKLPRPEVDVPDPDMLVCPHCKEGIQGDGDD